MSSSNAVWIQCNMHARVLQEESAGSGGRAEGAPRGGGRAGTKYACACMSARKQVPAAYHLVHVSASHVQRGCAQRGASRFASPSLGTFGRLQAAQQSAWHLRIGRGGKPGPVSAPPMRRGLCLRACLALAALMCRMSDGSARQSLQRPTRCRLRQQSAAAAAARRPPSPAPAPPPCPAGHGGRKAKLPCAAAPGSVLHRRFRAPVGRRPPAGLRLRG